MRWRLLKENEALNVRSKVTNLAWGDGSYVSVETSRMIVVTDGEIAEENIENVKDDGSFIAGERTYNVDYDTITTRDVSFRSFSYVITFLIEERPLHNGRAFACKDCLFDETVYLADLNDKSAKEKAKTAIRTIHSIFGVNSDFTVETDTPDPEYAEELSRYVYRLVK